VAHFADELDDTEEAESLGSASSFFRYRNQMEIADIE